jgi:hypothetical protein
MSSPTKSSFLFWDCKIATRYQQQCCEPADLLVPKIERRYLC